MDSDSSDDPTTSNRDQAANVENRKVQGDKEDNEEANIEKTIRFWSHPALRSIPSDQKRSYLHERGVTDSQISKAWERIAENDDRPSPLHLRLQELLHVAALNTIAGEGHSSQSLQAAHTEYQETFDSALADDATAEYLFLC